jgi:putative RecB family exonuclease
MPIYSYSRIGAYEQCPLKYKLSYIDRIKRDTEGIEAFLGKMVHETLQKCYDDARYTKVNPLDDLLSYYDSVWQKNWHDSIAITREHLTRDHYHALGKRMIESYHRRHFPFDSDRTVATEMMVNFPLDDAGRYRLRGFIDRLSRTPEGVYRIHDYKTSAHLPTQEDADRDRQLALYQIGIQRKWPDTQDIQLIWHYLAFDRDLVSSRSPDALTRLTEDTMRAIDEIEAAERFPPRESALCNWCEYPDLCPQRKHLVAVEALPVNEYLSEPGVALVNRYAELKDQAGEIADETEKVKKALVDYARREGVEVVRGSDHKVRVKIDEKLKFPGKSDEGRSQLDTLIIGAEKWMDVSQLDTTALNRAVEEGLWDRDLVDQVMQYGRIDETSTVYLSKLKDEEK